MRFRTLRTFPVAATLVAAVLAQTTFLAGLAGAQSDEADLNSRVTRWSKPLRGDPLDIAFIVPEFGQNDVREFAARFDFRAEPDGPTDDLSGVDAVVVSTVSQHELRRETWDLVLRSFEQGTGLVAVTFNGELPRTLERYFRRARELDSTAAIFRGVRLGSGPDLEAAPDFVKLYEHRGARLAVVDYSGKRPETHGLSPYIDGARRDAEDEYAAYLSVIARALMWAGRHDTWDRIVRIENFGPIGPAEVETPPQLPPQFIQRVEDMTITTPLHPFVLHLDKPAERRYAVRVRLRYPDRGSSWTYTSEKPLQPGSRRYEIGVPVGLGNIVADFSIADRKTTVDWFTTDIQGDGWPEIANVFFSEGPLEVNDDVSVRFDLRRNYYKPRPAGLYLRAVDSYGRVVAENRVRLPSEGGAMRASLALVDLMTPRVTVELFVADRPDGPTRAWQMQRVAYDSAEYSVNVAPTPSFRFEYTAPAAEEINARTFAETLRRLGAVPFHAGDAPELADFGTNPRPPEFVRARAWDAVLNGLTGIFVGPAYSTNSAPLANSAVTGDGTPSGWFTALARDVEEIRSGYGYLFSAASRDDSRARKFVLESSAVTARGFTFSDAFVLALSASPNGTVKEKVKLRFDESLVVYDMIEKKIVERRGAVTRKLSPGDIVLYALLPYPVTRVAVEAPERLSAGRRLPVRVSIKTGDRLPGDHIVHLTLAVSGEEPLPYYARDVVCEDGQGETYIPLAANETPGLYDLTVRDVLTGKSTTARIRIEP